VQVEMRVNRIDHRRFQEVNKKKKLIVGLYFYV